MSFIPIFFAASAFAAGWATLTLPSHSAKRALPLVLAAALVALVRQNDLSASYLLNEMFGRLLILWLLYMPFLVYIQGYDAASHVLFGQKHTHTVPSWPELRLSPQHRWRTISMVRNYICHLCRARGRCALKMLFNGRGINTEWQVRTLPTPRRQTRWVFCVRRLAALLAKYAAWQVWIRYSTRVIYLQGSDYIPEKQMFLRRLISGVLCNNVLTHCDIAHPVTMREVWVRLWIVVSNNIPSLIILKAFHDILAIFFVGIGFDTTDEWPPLFGSLRHVYTVRGYWSRFWQLILQRLLCGYATFILRRVLRCRQRSSFSHAVHGLLVFLISGIIHAVVYHFTMPGCGKGPVVVFYALQPVAFVVEGWVEQRWQKWRARYLNYSPARWGQVFTRTVGVTWVICWFFWLEPKSVLADKYSMAEYWQNKLQL
ncbi:hypothetical protein LOZ67_006185 [Ophidiomyces ophidiicola]|nr:hypothetical protein LOZ67_006185 [Ophidiomyces ophidiicola]KAI2438056.1 hypothetical protein LOZ08_005099 [Ophidiomyces ophidiicola]